MKEDETTMDVLKDIELQTAKNHFVNAFREHIRRAGSEELLEWLENETDFFTAPGLCGAPLRLSRRPADP